MLDRIHLKLQKLLRMRCHALRDQRNRDPCQQCAWRERTGQCRTGWKATADEIIQTCMGVNHTGLIHSDASFRRKRRATTHAIEFRSCVPNIATEDIDCLTSSEFPPSIEQLHFARIKIGDESLLGIIMLAKLK